MSNEEYFQNLRKLNYEQRLIFDDIMLHKRLNPNQKISLFITGGAGTGKTFLLLLIIQGLLRYYNHKQNENTENTKVLLMAYTGKAAFNIGGTTIHSALHLPLITNNQTSLSPEKLDELSLLYKDVQLIVIDEISLVGSNIFSLIDARMRAIKRNQNKPFGDLDIILCGDLCQASPVKDTWIFKKKIGLLETINPSYWQEYIKYYELTQPMRQENKTYIDILNRIRIGTQTLEDISYLNNNFYRPVPQNKQISYLYYDNLSKDKHNKIIFEQTKERENILIATDKKSRTCSAKIKIPNDARLCGGLHKILELKPGLTVELCAGNLNISDGLVNGAEGTYRQYTATNNIPIVWIHFFNNSVGIRTRYEKQNLYSEDIPKEWTPIQKTTREFQIGKNLMNTVTRTQFPLQPAAARTIHRSQGLTLHTLAFSPHKIKTHGLIYTALSRIKDPSNLYLLEKIQANQIKIDREVINETNRLITDANWTIINKDITKYKDTKIIIQSINTNSLNSHYDDIKNDKNLMLSDILCIQETRNPPHTKQHFPNYTTILSNGPYGTSIHYRNDATILDIEKKIFPSFEIVSATIALAKKQALTILSAYRKPSSKLSIFIDALDTLLQQKKTEYLTILLGDFNIHVSEANPQYITLQNTLKKHNLHQHVLDPTTIYNSILDHIWITLPVTNIITGTNYCYWSDHSIIYAILPP